MNVRVFTVLVVCFVSLALAQSVAQEKATPQDMINKVQEAAALLAKSGEPALPAFNQKGPPWMFKDSYVFVFDCSKNVVAAHPIKPEFIGVVAKDSKGTDFETPVCAGTRGSGGMWVEFWVNKPGEKEASRKVGYALRAGTTSYVAI